MTASSAAGLSPDPRSASVSPDAGSTIRPLLEGALRRIAQFAQLQPDWDSYGGDPPSQVALAEAGRWVEIVGDLFGPRAGTAAAPYSVAPLADGGIQLEWRGVNGTVELEVGRNGELGYLLVASEDSGTHTEEVDDASWSDVLRLLFRMLVV